MYCGLGWWVVDLRWTDFDAIYHEYGSLVIVYENIRRARRACTFLLQASFDEKTLLVLVLPHLQVNYSHTHQPNSLCSFSDARWTMFEVIYYEYGALVLVFHKVHTAKKCLAQLRDAVFDDKQLLVLLLPHIEVRATLT